MKPSFLFLNKRVKTIKQIREPSRMEKKGKKSLYKIFALIKILIYGI